MRRNRRQGHEAHSGLLLAAGVALASMARAVRHSSVDLDTNFPWLHYVTTQDFIEQILFLDSLGGEVY